MRSIAITCATCVTLTAAAAAQQEGIPERIEKGSTGIGSRVSFFFSGGPSFRAGIEVGYSKMGRSEQQTFLGDPMFGSGFESTTSSTRLYHATVVARRQWPTLDRNVSFYAVGGTGIYLGQTSTERFLSDANARVLGRDMKVSTQDWEFGANVGVGIELKRVGWPGAIDLDARFHVLPFSGPSGPRTLLTFSAGLNFF
jgi:hypothetical protein